MEERSLKLKDKKLLFRKCSNDHENDKMFRSDKYKILTVQNDARKSKLQ